MAIQDATRSSSSKVVITDIRIEDNKICYTIENVGGAEAGRSYSGLYIDGRYLARDSVDGLAAGAKSTTECFERYNYRGGTIKVCADYQDRIEEINESNNCRGPPAEKPDLVIEDKWEEWINATHYSVTYVIHNKGTATAPAGHNTSLFVDGEEIEDKQVPVNLTPRESYTDTFDTVIACTGESDTIRVCADNDDVIDELNEDNNCLENVVSCIGIPTITKSSSPTSVSPGGTVNYTINYTYAVGSNLTNVTITENYPAGVTFISAKPVPDAGTNNVWTIGTLLPGESGTIVIKVKVPEQIDLYFTETGSVIGEGLVMVTKDLSTEQKPYSLKNSVTLSCTELAPKSAFATTKVSGVPGTSLGITESGSGVYSSDEILDLQTKNRTIILEKTTHAE